MAITDIELKQMLVDFVTTNPGWTWVEANEETGKFGIWHKTDAQLTALQEMYKEKVKRIYQFYKEHRDELKANVSGTYVDDTTEDDFPTLRDLKQKIMRIAKKWRAVNAEIAGRDAGKFGPGLEFDRKYQE